MTISATSSLASPGLGSGLDVNSLVSKLMTVEQIPVTQLETQQAALTAQFSAYGALAGSLSVFQTAAVALSTPSSFALTSASVDVPSVLSVASNSSATPGNYSISVQQVATDQRLISMGYASKTTTSVASGSSATLNMSFGNPAKNTVAVHIDTLNNSLAGISAAINAAGAGVSAGIMYDGSSHGYRLVVSSTNTGTDGAVTLDSTNPGLMALIASMSARAEWSQGYADSTSNVASSTTNASLTLRVGTTSSALSLGANSSLANIRDAINAGNSSVTGDTPTFVASLDSNNSLTINNVLIDAIPQASDAATQGQQIAQAINNANISNVTAGADAGGKVTLTSTNNTDITVVASGSAATNTGISSGINAIDRSLAVSGGNPTAPQALDDRNYLVINGTTINRANANADLGVQGQNIADAINSALVADGKNDVTASADSAGKITLTSTNNTDINVAVFGSASTIAGIAAGTTSSNKTFEISGAAPAMAAALDANNYLVINDVTINQATADGNLAQQGQNIADAINAKLMANHIDITASADQTTGKITLTSTNNTDINVAVVGSAANITGVAAGTTSSNKTFEISGIAPAMSAALDVNNYLVINDVTINQAAADANLAQQGQNIADAINTALTANHIDITASADQTTGKITLSSTGNTPITVVAYGSAATITGISSDLPMARTGGATVSGAGPNHPAALDGNNYLAINGVNIDNVSADTDPVKQGQDLASAISAGLFSYYGDHRISASADQTTGKITLSSTGNTPINVVAYGSAATVTGIGSGAPMTSTGGATVLGAGPNHPAALDGNNRLVINGFSIDQAAADGNLSQQGQNIAVAINAKLTVNHIDITASADSTTGKITLSSTNETDINVGVVGNASSTTGLQSGAYLANHGISVTGTFPTIPLAALDANNYLIINNTQIKSAAAGRDAAEQGQNIANAINAAGIAHVTASADGHGRITLSSSYGAIDVNSVGSGSANSGIRVGITASSGYGVTARIVNDGTKDHMVLTPDNEHSDVTMSSSDAGLAALATGMSTTSAISAQDAKLTVDGIAVQKSSNILTDVIQGVTLTLGSTGSAQVTVAQDTATLATNIKNLISAYNSVNATIDADTAYDPATRTASVLNGDSALRSLQSSLHNVFNKVVAGADVAYSRLADVGISYRKDTDGVSRMMVDSAKLQSALASSGISVRSLFAKTTYTTGYASQINDLVNHYIGDNGILTVRSTGITSASKRIDGSIASLKLRIDQISKNYMAQFIALDTSITSMQATSTFLTQQLAMLSRTG